MSLTQQPTDLDDIGRNTRIVVRPLATPLPLGFLGLMVATMSFAAVQLSWIPAAQQSRVALAVLVLTVPVQLIASVMGFLARDAVAATGMGILAGTWASVALVTLISTPGSFSPGLGVVIVSTGTAMLVPAVAAVAKPVAALVMGMSAARFIVTGIAQLRGSSDWLTAAGWVGFALALVSLYAALAFELESVRQRGVLPLFRGASSQVALREGIAARPGDVAREPGVRPEL